MKTLLSIIFITSTICLTAQDKLTVEYSYRNEFDTSNIEDDFMLKLYKKSNEKTFYYLLTINDNEATFQDIPRVNNSQDKEEYTISGPLGKSYINLDTRETLNEVEYAGKYLIKDSINKIDWVIERERGKYLGFETRKATYKNEILAYEAWFVPSIPLKFGPNGYGELPGLIVKFTHYFNNKFGNHKRTFIADKIIMNEKISVVKPTKGKILSQKEFNLIVEEQNKKYKEIEDNQLNTKID